jgi:RNA polymerase sigma factor (sigma-70 family)
MSRLNLSRLSDADLASLSAAGDRDAFGLLVARHGGLVRGLIRRMGAQPSLADDIAQDAFVAAFTNISGYRGDGAFGSWVCRIAARLYVKRVRKEARYDLMADTPEEADDQPDPGVAMDLDAALCALSEAERLCVSLCSGAGHSHPEVAEMLDLPLGTVKSHVKRGLDKLRRRLAPPQTDTGTTRSLGHV